LENILRIASETELYAPDVPAFGDGVFDRAFFDAHKEELLEAEALFCDEESKSIFSKVVEYKLTGNIRPLLEAVSDPQQVMEELVQPQTISAAADLGAYNGDTVRELLAACNGAVKKIWAMEPDRRNFRKLQDYAQQESRAEVQAIQAGAWCEDTVLCFDASGNRNASFGTNRSESLADRPVKLIEMEARRLDSVLDGARVDYIKYDVEGSEAEALLGAGETIRRFAPTMLVSLYHRNEDLFKLPLQIKREFPVYTRFYLRRFAGIPAWDLNLYCKK